MPSRPSEPLLAFLRDTARKKGLATPHLAEKSGIERGRLKRCLSGTDDLTVDELILLSKALELTPAEMGLGGGETPEAPADEAEHGHAAEPEEPVGADPFGNLPKQVIRLGIDLGIDLFLVLDATQLAGSGIPKAVLTENREQLRLRMEARWFPQNKFRFLDDALVCVLSFDALYECTLPWSAIRTVTFLLPVEAPRPAAPEPEPPARPAAPFLRVVK